MPLYEYQCRKCGQTYEVRQRFADEPLTVHEGCGGEVERLISTSAFQFKGSGWYVTDYARGGKSSSESSNGKTENKADAAKTEKTESKSETKSENKSDSKPAPTKSS